MSDCQQILPGGDNFLSDQMPVCNICGDGHETEFCSILHNAKPVPDTQTVSRARLTLPCSLEVRSLADGSTTVVAKSRFERGTLFGPFQAQLSVDMHPAVCLPLKVFGKAAGEGYYLDTTDEDTCNWMCLVAPATTSSEQNLICYDMKESIYYTCIRDVLPGEELRVWYALYYGFKLQALPLSDDTSGDVLWDLSEEGMEPKSKLKNADGLVLGNELAGTLAQHLPAQTLGAKGDRETWKCQLCGVEERNVASYARHLMAHYRRPVPITERMKCPLCDKHFHCVKGLVKRECKHCRAVIPNSFFEAQTPEKVLNHNTHHQKGVGDCADTSVSEEVVVTKHASITSESQSLSGNFDEWRQQQRQQQHHQWQRHRQKLQRWRRQRQQWQRKRIQWQHRRHQQKLKKKINHEHDKEHGHQSVSVNFIPSVDDSNCCKNELTTSNHDTRRSTGKLMSLASISSFELQNISVGCESTSCERNEGESQCSIQSDIKSISTSEQLWSADDAEQPREDSLSTQQKESEPQILSEILGAERRICGDVGEGASSASFGVSDAYSTDELSGSPTMGVASAPSRTVHNQSISDENETEPPHFTIDSRTQFFLQTEDGVTIPTSFRLDGSQSIDVALDDSEPVTFILVNSTENIKSTDRIKSEMEMEEKVPEFITEDKPGRSESIHTDLSSYHCDICNKVFDKSEYLYRHLRKHTGEFTCMSCLAVFARKENLKSHSCTRSVVRYPCPSCGKKFSSKKYLQRHMPLHTSEFMCRDCHKSFVSKMSLSVHRCTAGQRTGEFMCRDCHKSFVSQMSLSVHQCTASQTVASINCNLCNRIFFNRAKLQAHLKHHSEVKSDGVRSFHSNTSAKHKARKCHQTICYEDMKSDDNTVLHDKEFVCEVCGAIFKSASSMKTHSFIHGERRFQCEVCNKRFHRKDVLQDHLTVHQAAKVPCPVCGKKYKTKKSLDVHMLIHGGAKRFCCDECGKEFFQKGNLQKHQQTHTPSAERVYPCQHCSKTFTSKEYLNVHTLEHTQGKIFSCEICSKSFVKKHLLESHRQLYHSNRAYLCKFCNSLMRHRHSARRHLEQRHDDHRDQWSAGGFIEKMLAELPDSSNLLTPNEGPLTPIQQQKRQQTLLALRRQHFGDDSLPNTVCAVVEELDTTVDYLYTVLPNADPQQVECQTHPPTEGQPEQQLALLENLLLDSSVQEPTITTGVMQGSEILLTVVGTNTFSHSNSGNQEALIFSGNEISAEDGNTYVIGSDGENSGVLLYVLDGGDTNDAQDLIWDTQVDGK